MTETDDTGAAPKAERQGTQRGPFRLLFLHGREGNPHGTKATWLREWFQATIPGLDTSSIEAARSDALAEAIAAAKRNEVEVARLKVEVMDLSARLYFAEDQLAAYKQRFGDL